MAYAKENLRPEVEATGKSDGWVLVMGALAQEREKEGNVACMRTGEGKTGRASGGRDEQAMDRRRLAGERLGVASERQTGQGHELRGILPPAANWGRLWCWISGKFFTGKERRLRRGNRRTERERSGEPNRFLQRFFLTASGC